MIDESHKTIPQIGGMYHGDQSRKSTLVDYGFRLPSAKDNRPLNFEEFESKINQALFVSATPGVYEEEHELLRVEQVIRPTGLLDPEVVVRPVEGQIDDLIGEINKEISQKNKVLVTTLTKRMAEDLTDYMREVGIRVKYLHSDVDTLERTEIIRDMSLDVFDVLVGINLLREGLDIPEITLVAILDADKEGFLRSETSLIQTIGRAARNAQGHVIMYAYKITESMQLSIDETILRLEIQMKYNEEHGITPKTIQKSVRDLISISKPAAAAALPAALVASAALVAALFAFVAAALAVAAASVAGLPSRVSGALTSSVPRNAGRLLMLSSEVTSVSSFTPWLSALIAFRMSFLSSVFSDSVSAISYSSFFYCCQSL